MATFGDRSKRILRTVDPRLVAVLSQVIKIYDFSVLCGFRSEATQEELFAQGRTKVHFPDSKHNSSPSKAVDIAPYPIDWNDSKRFIYLAGLMVGTAHKQGLTLRWGGNWDMDDVIIDDQNFDDLPHFEIWE